jgi:asparagine synthase (glutamine-hydrolysing)
MEKVNATLAPYGPDSNESYSKDGVKILYRAFHTTNESHRETQPHVSASGEVIAWDGRVDNRPELINQLRDTVNTNSTDVEIVAAAFERWGDKCFAKLVGDWALSIWNPINRSLILAKDPIGIRHLFYSFDNDQVTWSTMLDPLVLFAGRTFSICEEYIAGWFAMMFPAAHLTPYVGIHAVAPSSSVLLRPGKHIVNKYWDFDSGKRIRYRTDAEYEEHFRTVLAEAVRQRLRSDQPILAELSGGMDSSSIVCMADTIIARGAAETPRLDTISWYNDCNADLDERPYFTKVEEKRGRTGYHIDLSSLRDPGPQPVFGSEFESNWFAATPNSCGRLSELLERYDACLMSQGYRVTLAGFGGDEVMGGVPTPTPELQDLLAGARFFTLARQLKAWAAKMRKSRFPLLWEATRGFFPLALVGAPKDMHPAPWFSSGFVRRNCTALRGYPSRVKLFGPLPSFQDNAGTLEITRRLLSYCATSPELLRERRYPYVDRRLLEFMYAIPREQIVRVGIRRSLMKRALIGIVPDELLNRKRKAFIAPEPKRDNSTEWPSLTEVGQHIVVSSIGIIDPNRFLEALRRARRNEDIPVDILRDTITLESWLRHLVIHGVLTTSVSAKGYGYLSVAEAEERRNAEHMLQANVQLASCVHEYNTERR